MANGKIKQLLKYQDISFNEESVTAPGKDGYYGSIRSLTVPNGYTPISAQWISDFVTGVFPVLSKGNKVCLVSKSSISTVGNAAIVRVFYAPLKVVGGVKQNLPLVLSGTGVPHEWNSKKNQFCCRWVQRKAKDVWFWK